MRGKFVCLFSMFVALLFQSVLLHGQISLRDVSCGAAVVEFENASGEDLMFELFTMGAADTLIFAEDFSPAYNKFLHFA